MAEPGQKEPTPQQISAHLRTMPGFKRLRPTYKKLIPKIRENIDNELQGQRQNTPAQVIRALKRTAFHTAEPIERERARLEEANRKAIENRIQEEEIRQKLEQMATKDPLTGLGNRRFFEDALEVMNGLALRNKQNFAVVLLDINGLKEINDTKGHQAGDEMLQDVATTLLAALRDSDIVTRWGGDEFGILLPYTDENGAVEAIINLQEQLQVNTSMTGSFGIIVSDGTLTDDLFMHADRAMYNAKSRKAIPGDPCITTYNHKTDQYNPVKRANI